MDKQQYARRVGRLWMLGVFFLACCVIAVIRLGTLDLSSENIRGHKPDGTTTRTEIVQAVRGQIYDRNGVPLVTNRYTYSLTMDYSVLPSENDARNRAIIRTLVALESCGEGDRFCTWEYPFAGVYPDLSYSETATDPDSKEYRALVNVFKNSGLRATLLQKIRADKNCTLTKAGELFDADPLSYADAKTLVRYFEKTYGLTDTTQDGTPLYTDTTIDRLIRVLWGMEAVGFSRANDYTLASDVSMDTVTFVLEQGIPGVRFSTSSARVYTYPGYASHILGQTGPIFAEDWEYYKELGYNMNAIVGISGCEATFESYLHGQDGVRVIREDADGRIVDEYMKTEAVAGQDIYLTIDITLQIAAEDGLRENVNYIRSTFNRTDCKSGAAVAMDPATGEILALASYPSFDLTTFHQDYASLSSDDALPLYNRVLFGQYAPGSTFKPGMVAAAMTEGTIDASTLLECAGVYTYYQSYQPACWIYNSTGSVHCHGYLNAHEALRVSCNCFFYEVGRRLGIAQMNRYFAAYGLGQPTGIELGEASGILAGPDYRAASHGVLWQPTDTIAAAIGQSDNAFTPLQLSVYMSTLFNGGDRCRAHLLLRVRDFTTRTDTLTVQPEVTDHIDLDPVALHEVVTGMEEAVTTTAGVWRYMSSLPVSVAGKTGTAQTGGKQTDNGLFVCAAPSRNPEIVVTAVVERAGGGSYAALAAGRILTAYFSK